MDPIRLVEDKDRSLQLLVGEKKLSIHPGDILSLTADALVCPVDPSLNCQKGLINEINLATGKKIHIDRPVLPEPYGKVIVFPGGKLKAKYLFLTVLLGE
jgi:O-acetyl-ADP-ribose deacetylase (regulator of RNase III)